MKLLKVALTIILYCVVSSAWAFPNITNMRNTSLQSEINTVKDVNLSNALTMAMKIWQKKQTKLYHSTLPGAEAWYGQKVYSLISLALTRENQRLTSNPKQSTSLVGPLTQMLVLLQNTTHPDQDIREARLLFSQALMLEEARLYGADIKS